MTLTMNIKVTLSNPQPKSKLEPVDKYDSGILIYRKYPKVETDQDKLYGIKKVLLKY